MDDKSTQEQSGKKKKSWKKILKTSVVFIPLLFLSLILVPQFDVVSDFPPSLILYEDLILLLVLGIPVILSVVFYQYFIPKKYGLLIFMSGIIGILILITIGFTDLSKSGNSGVSTRTSTSSSTTTSTSVVGTWIDGRDGANYTFSSSGTFNYRGSMGSDRGRYKQSGSSITFYMDGIEVGSGYISGKSLSANVGYDSFQGVRK